MPLNGIERSLIATQAAQIAVLAIVVACVAHWQGRRRPHLAHLLWLVVLLKCVTPPWIASPVAPLSWIGTATPAPDVDPGISDPQLPEGDSRHASTVPAPAADDPAPRAASIPVAVEDSELLSLANKPARVWSLPQLLVAAWLLIACSLIVLAAWRWRRCWQTIRLGERPPASELAEQLTALSQRLGLRQHVRLLVTEARVGPAVIGLVRPTLVLPALIVDRSTPADLAPILTHELLHVRRGDLWVAMLQFVVRGLWWFHPMAWYAQRAVGHAAEQCCDAETLAALQCSPAVYARSLLRVLELKRELVPAPACPGIRPLEITVQRLENIMRSGQGCRRASWRTWLLFGMAAAVALPGSRFIPVGASEQEAQGKPPVDAGTRQSLEFFLGREESSPADVSKAASADKPADDYRRIHEVIEVGDLLDKLQAERALNEDAARVLLKEYVFNRAQLTRVGEAIGPPAPKQIPLDGLRCEGTKLVVELSAEDHRSIVDAVAQLRQHGFDQIEVQVRWAWGPVKTIHALSNRWVTLPQPAPWNGNSPEDLQAPVPAESTSSMSVERRPPVLLDVLDGVRLKKVTDAIAADRKSHLLSAPRIRLGNGQMGYVSAAEHRPFVVGVEPIVGSQATALKPRIGVLANGCLVKVQPELHGGKINLNYDTLLSIIGKVETMHMVDADSQQKYEVQVPEVTRLRIASQTEIPLGQTLLVGGLKHLDQQGNDVALVVLIEANRVTPPPFVLPKLNAADSPATRPSAAPDVEHAYPVVYAVADLVVPRPGMDDAPIGPDGNPDFRPAMESLRELIETTVAPLSWKASEVSAAITLYPANLSLVVSQIRENHEQIAALLAQLRTLREAQIVLGMRGIPASFSQDKNLASLFPRSDADQGVRILTSADAQLLVDAVQRSKLASRLFNAKVTVFNNQQISLEDPSAGSAISPAPFRLQARRVEPDRLGLRLIVAGKSLEPLVSNSLEIREGDSLLIDVQRLEQIQIAGTLEAKKHQAAKPALTASEFGRYVIVTPHYLALAIEEISARAK